MAQTKNALIRQRVINRCLSSPKQYSIIDMMETCNIALEEAGYKPVTSKTTILEDLRGIESNFPEARIIQKKSVRNLVNLNDLNLEALMCAQDIIKCFFWSPSGRYNKFNEDYSSYGFKHLIERLLNKITKGRINYISNGTAILALHHSGFKFQRIPGTPNCLFNVPKKCYKRMEIAIDRMCKQ